MNRVRLLPIVIVAASGLFVLKATELLSSGDRIMAAAPPPPAAKAPVTEQDLPKFARALARHRLQGPSDPEHTGAVPSKKDDKKEPGKDEAKTAQAPAKEVANDPSQAKHAEPKTPPQPLPPPAGSAERAVLERLQERRGAIDDRARELELRENLLQAAERKLDGRINTLKEIEGRMDAGAKAEQVDAEKQLRTVVQMYETMKAKDAARVFDRLKLDVLVPIATTMKPARMAEILAVMSPEAAERLTVALASKPEAKPAQAAAAAAPPGELPRLDASGRPRR